MTTSSTTTMGNLPTNLLRSRDSGISVQEPTNLSDPTDLLIGQLLKQNKEQLFILRSILDKQGRPGSKNKSTESDSLSERTVLGDLKEFTGGMKDQLLDIAGYVTGVNFFRKKQKENNTKTTTTENTVDNTSKDTTQTQVQSPPLKAAPAPTSQIIERITEEKSTPILGNLQALFTNMLEEVTVIRKFVEGTLSINTFKGGSKYIERDYQNQKVRHINEDAARLGKALNLNPISTTQGPKGIELSDNDTTKEDSYIEKLSSAIANKLASLLEDVGIGSKGIPGIDIDVGGPNKGGGKGKTPPKGPGGKTPKAPSKFGAALSIGMGLLGIGASAALYSSDLGDGELPSEVKDQQERIANMSESERKAYYDKINENSKIKPRDETSEERLKRLGVTPNESAGGGRGNILPPMIPPVDSAVKSSDGSILKDATEENMFAKMNQSMMGSLQPITSNNIIDNSSNQLMAVAPSVRNDYSSWLRYQHANMVG